MEMGRDCDLEALTVGQHRADGCRRCGCFYYEANGELRRVPPDDEEPTSVAAPPACYPPPSGSFSFVPVEEKNRRESQQRADALFCRMAG